MTATRLTPKQARYVHEYLLDLNPPKAARRAGYAERGISVAANRLLNNVKVTAAIAAAMKDRERRNEITEDKVLQEYARIAFADMEVYASWGPNGVELRESSQLPAGATAVVSEVSESVTEKGGRTVRFKLHDKQAALGMLARHLNMMIERKEHTGADGGPILQETITLDITASDLGSVLRTLRDAGAVRLSNNGQAPDALDEVHPA